MKISKSCLLCYTCEHVTITATSNSCLVLGQSPLPLSCLLSGTNHQVSPPRHAVLPGRPGSCALQAETPRLVIPRLPASRGDLLTSPNRILFAKWYLLLGLPETAVLLQSKTVFLPSNTPHPGLPHPPPSVHILDVNFSAMHEIKPLVDVTRSLHVFNPH